MNSETKLIATVVIASIVLVLGGIFAFNLYQNNDAGEIMVVQNPLNGHLDVYTDGGMKPVMFGKVTRYKKRETFWFSDKAKDGKIDGSPIAVRFNDGAQAKVSGSISWSMPEDTKNVLLLHTKFGSFKAVEQQLVETAISKSIYTSGPLMSSTESYAERKNEFLGDVEEQILDGVYETETIPTNMKDPMTGQPKTVNVVKVKVDDSGKPKHALMSPLTEFGIKTFNLQLSVDYDTEVEKQIQAQQEANMGVQISIAKAKQAEQNAITIAKEGEAEAMKAKWGMEVEKSKAVTEAEKNFRVSEFLVRTEDNNKKAAILKGEGEAEARKLVMTADGALDKKLSTYERVNQAYASAIKDYQGSWVPSVVMGSDSNSSRAGSGANNLIDLLMVKTARDLNLDLSMPSGRKTTEK